MRALFVTKQQPTGFIYSVDARVKILVAFLAGLLVIVLSSPVALGFLAVASVFYGLLLRKLKLLAIAYTFIILMVVIALGFAALLHGVFPSFPAASFSGTTVPFLRTVISLNAVLVLAFSSRVHVLLSVLKSIYLPIWIYLPASVMIAFVPLFITDMKQIYETLKIRGHKLGPAFFIRYPRLASRLLIAPLVFRSLRSAADLGIAAELKGISAKAKMSSYKPLHFSRTDMIALAIPLLLMGASIALQVAYAPETVRGM